MTRPKEEIYHTLQDCAPLLAMWRRSLTSAPHSNCWRGAFFQCIDHPDAGTATYPGAPFTIQGAAWHQSGRRVWVSTMWRCTATASVTPERTWRSCVVPVSSKEQGESMKQFALEEPYSRPDAGGSGTICHALLGFMGAEVIKVESCSRMDISRGAAWPTSQGEGLYPGGEPGERPQ